MAGRPPACFIIIFIYFFSGGFSLYGFRMPIFYVFFFFLRQARNVSACVSWRAFRAALYMGEREDARARARARVCVCHVDYRERQTFLA